MEKLRCTIKFTALSGAPLITLALLAGAAAPASASGATGTARGDAPAGSVSGPSVSLSTPAAGASRVVYTVGFTTSAGGALASGSGTVTLAGPAGTVFDNQQTIYQFTDVTSGATGTEFGFQGTVSQHGAAMTMPVPVSVAAGDRVTIKAPGAASAPGAGARQLAVSTSSDTTPVMAGFTLTTARPVRSASVRLSSPAGGATKVVYTARFTASATGALVAGQNVAGSGEITLAAPAGTVFSGDLANYQFDDVTTGKTGSTFGFNGVVSDGGAAISLPVPISIAPGDQVTVTAPGVSSTASGARSLAISTTSDTPAGHAGYMLVAPSPVGAPSVRVSTTAAGATQVAYKVVFTASKTGGLAPDPTFTAGASDVILSAPAGTVFDHNLASYRFDDLTSKQTGNIFGFEGTISRAGATISVPVPIAISGGDKVSVTIGGVASPHGAGPAKLTVSTSSDTRAAIAAFKLTAPLRVQGLEVSLGFIEAGAPGTRYTIGFATSGTGDLQQDGEITVSGPPGTVFPADSADYCVQSAGTAFCAPVISVTEPKGGTGSTVSLVLFDAIPAGTQSVLTITGVHNGNSGADKLTVSTSSDVVPASTHFQLIPWSGSEVTGTVTFQGAPQAGVQLLTCPVAGTPGACQSAVTDGNGTYLEPTGFGTYAITATPASTIAAATTVQVTVTSAHPVVTQPIALPKPAGLPSGTTFSATGQTFTPGQVPTLFWEGSSTFTTTGPKNSVGAVVVTGTNPVSGAQQDVSAALIETPRGSGKYTATIPAMYPVHGAVTVRAMVLPHSSFPPTPTDLRGGSVSGGTRLLAVVHGNATAILFGGRPGTGLQQVAPGLYAVISPAGAGKVPMTAVVSAAAGPAGGRVPRQSDVSLGDWTYLPAPQLSSISGSGDGGTVTVAGSDLGSDPMVFFGDDPSRDVTQTGPDTYSVSVPPGEGTEQVTAVAPDVGYVAAGTYTRTTTPSDLAAELQNYFNEFGDLQFLADLAKADTPAGVAGAVETLAEPLISAVTGYQFVSGPSGALLSTFGTELLVAGPEGLAMYIGLRIITNELDKSVFASFGANIDPSGTVVDRSGRPVAGAKATLQIRTGPGGVFAAVAATSTGISPHVNPETTGKDGRFDWLAAAGVYRVHAVSASCKTARHQPASGNTVTFTLPPPAVGLVIVLPCQLGKAARPRVTGLSPAIVTAAGGPVLVTGTGIGAATRVTLGGHAVPFVLLGSGALQITAPPGAGTSQVVVTTRAGTSTSAPGAATLRYLSLVVPPPLDVAVHAVSPSAVAAITAPRFTTTSPGDLLLAFISASGPAGKVQRVTAVTGGGLRWTLVARSDAHGGTVEVWQARAKGAVQAAAITARLLDKAGGSLTVAAFTGARSVTALAAGGGRGGPSASLATVRPSSVIWAGGRDTSGTAAVRPAAGQSLVSLDRLAAGAGTGWVQVAPLVTGATRVRVADSAPTTVPWELVAVAIAPVT